MQCQQCGEHTEHVLTAEVRTTRGSRKRISLGPVCDKCKEQVIERTQRWPDTYLNPKEA